MPGKVLVVDDDMAFCTMVREALDANGYETRASFDPLGGAAVFNSFRPELVVLDVDMPAGGGKMMFRTVRQHPQGSATPIVVCTGSSTADIAWKKLEAVPDVRTVILMKPLDLKLLLKKLSLFLPAG